MLKSLEDWNRERWEKHRRESAALKARESGFACPRCRGELWIEDPHLIFGGGIDGDPMTRNLYCPSCLFRGVQLV